jgi:hypothetical protein
MSVSRLALFVVALAFVPLGIAAVAHQHHGPDWDWYGAVPTYNSRTEASFTGIVQAVNRVPASGECCWDTSHVYGAHLTLVTATETIDVHLGPAAMLDAKNVAIARGDTVRILGSRVMLGGTPVLLAKEVTRGDETWTLRDPAGFLLWNHRGGFPYGRHHHW